MNKSLILVLTAFVPLAAADEVKLKLFRRFCLSSRHLHLLLCLIRKGKSRMAYANGTRRDHNRGHRRPETFPVIRCAWLSFSAFSSCHL